MSRSGDRKSIRVGAAQFDAVAGDIAANIAAHERLIDDAGPDQPGMAVAELDAEQLSQARGSLQMLADHRADPAPIQTSTAQ